MSTETKRLSRRDAEIQLARDVVSMDADFKRLRAFAEQSWSNIEIVKRLDALHMSFLIFCNVNRTQQITDRDPLEK